MYTVKKQLHSSLFVKKHFPVSDKKYAPRPQTASHSRRKARQANIFIWMFSHFKNKMTIIILHENFKRAQRNSHECPEVKKKKVEFITSLINYIYSFMKQTYFWGHHHWFQTQKTQLHCPLHDMNWDRLNKIKTEFYS